MVGTPPFIERKGPSSKEVDTRIVGATEDAVALGVVDERTFFAPSDLSTFD